MTGVTYHPKVYMDFCESTQYITGLNVKNTFMIMAPKRSSWKLNQQLRGIELFRHKCTLSIRAAKPLLRSQHCFAIEKNFSSPSSPRQLLQTWKQWLHQLNQCSSNSKYTRIYRCETRCNSFSSHAVPCELLFLPAKPRPASSFTNFNKHTTHKLREDQTQKSKLATLNITNNDCWPSINTKWRHADLKKYNQYRTFAPSQKWPLKLIRAQPSHKRNECWLPILCKRTPELEQERQELFASEKNWLLYKKLTLERLVAT